MIFITGDTHIPIDIHKLSMKEFPEQKTLTKKDYVIICGDFGGVWNNGEEEMYWRKWLLERNFTTLFVDGNHENFNLLNKFPITEWNGGNVHMVNDSIIHLMRGQVYNIDGFKFFTMGGATSIDKQFRRPNISWWAEEEPSKTEYDIALDNLYANNWTVDYILTHDAPSHILLKLYGISTNNTQINQFFEIVYEQLEFKKWFCGHHHIDKKIEKCTIVYDVIMKIL